MTKANSAELIFIVDRSGSMHDIASDMEGGFRTLIEGQRKLPGECFVSLVQFDTVYEPVYTRRPVTDVPPLIIVPRGGTALLDAIGNTIVTTGARLASMPDAERPDRVLVIIMTDGHENESKEYRRAKIMEMIAHQRAHFSWEFMFLGADQESIDEAHQLGIGSSLRYNKAQRGSVGAAYGATSSSAAQYRSSGKLMTNDEVKTSYNANLPPVAGTIDSAVPVAVPVIVVNVATIPGAVKPEEP